ncbi:MAG TPA: ABC transporter ATP-binding protein [Alphaproteobacteria bacterium]|nr:ABC transporter ATP-binding protein [Alphaproteobacteria bacterium]
MPDLLALGEVTAGYADTVVLENVSLAVGAEEAVALLGRNGVGKTTLLATIMGLTTLRGGRLAFASRDLVPMPVHERAALGVGYVPQEREIFASLSVDDNLRVATRPGEWTRERVYDLFPRLAARRRNNGNQLSGGEQQMLAVGRALVGNPRVLLLDEPFEGLAPVLVDSLMAALLRLRQESRIAMLLVEQHVELALEITRRAVVLDKGQVVWEGESAALAADRERLAALIGLQEMPSG